MLMADTTLMDKLVSLSKRRGFIFQSSEIYGGLGSVWDYGPLGVELKKNVKDRWWQAMVHARDDIEGLDAAILMHPKVWEASGHVAGFTDPLVDCRHCKNRFRADDPRIKGTPGQPDAQCPVCGSKGTLTEPRLFNLMFKTFMGPVEDRRPLSICAPRRPRGYTSTISTCSIVAPEGALRDRPDREGVPQRDHAGELHLPDPRIRADGDAVLRQAGDRCRVVRALARVADGVARTWTHARQAPLSSARPDELAHYAKAAFDIQYEFPFGWQEIEGMHNRTDFDLGRHQEYSGKKLEYFDQARTSAISPTSSRPRPAPTGWR